MNSQALPWYRHFWVWVTIILPFSAVVGATYSAVLAWKNADEIVPEEKVAIEVVDLQND